MSTILQLAPAVKLNPRRGKRGGTVVLRGRGWGRKADESTGSCGDEAETGIKSKAAGQRCNVRECETEAVKQKTPGGVRNGVSEAEKSGRRWVGWRGSTAQVRDEALELHPIVQVSWEEGGYIFRLTVQVSREKGG
jgi:hypothetical protein